MNLDDPQNPVAHVLALERASMEHLYVEHRSWLQGWLHKRLGNTADAADLTQDTFVRVLVQKSMASMREPRAYLTTVARGLLIDHWRRRELEIAYLDALAALPPQEQPAPELSVALLETLIEIDRMLDGLPRKVRAAFLAAQLEGLTYKEIALRLQVSVASVKLYVAKALLQCLLVAGDAA